MAQYDGSIRINTKISTKDAQTQLSAIESRMVKTADKVASLRSKMDALKNVKLPTDEYKKLENEAAALEKKLLSVYDRQERFLETGGKEGTTAYKRMAYDAETLEKKLQLAEQAMQSLVDSGKAFTIGSNTEEYSKVGQQLKYAENEMTTLSQKHGVLSLKVEKAENEYNKLGNTAENSLKKIGSAIKTAGTSSMQKFLNIAKKTGSSIKGIVSKMLSLGKSAKSSAKGLSSMSGGFKKILKYGLGIRSLYALVNKLRSAIKEGFSNLYNDSNMTGFKNQVDGLKASLLTLKNAFAAAFQPLVQLAIPYIQKAVQYITILTDKIGQLLASLTGQKTYTKAIQQTAAAFEDTADAAKDAEKATEGYLSPLDEINKFSSDKDKNSDNVSGTDGTTGTMFQEIPISEKFKNLAQTIKEMWQNADFTELGAIVGTKLNNALNGIDWTTIKETAARIGKSIGTLINGFVETDGLADSIGQTIGEAINTGITGINAFLDNTHWDSVGQFIGEGLNGLVNSINWQDIGHMLAQSLNAAFETIGEAAKTFDWFKFGSDLAESFNTWVQDFNWAENGAYLGEVIKGLLDTLIAFLEETDWQELGNKAADFIGNIDWNGIADRLFEAIGAVIGGLAAFLWGLIEDAWNNVVDWWHDVAFEDGKFTIQGLLDGIWEVIKNISKWINEHIFDPFIKGFKKAFGIHSPSTVMSEQGGFIISGLLDGLKNNIGAVLDWLKNIPEWFKEKFVAAYNFAKGAFSGAKDFFKDVWKGIKDAFGNIADWFKDKFSKAWQAVKDVFSKGGKVFNGIKDGILSGLKTVINVIIDGLNKVIAVPFNGLNSALGKLRNVSIAGFEPFDWLPTLSVPQIPRLAAGTVVPPNKEFLAVLGDNKQEHEVVSPLSTIKQAQKEAILEVMSTLGLNGGMGNQTIIIKQYLDSKQVAQAVVKEGKVQQMSSGTNMFMLGTT